MHRPWNASTWPRRPGRHESALQVDAVVVDSGMGPCLMEGVLSAIQVRCRSCSDFLAAGSLPNTSAVR